MIITMEKSVAGKKEFKKIFSEDLYVYLRNGWKKSDSPVTEEQKVVKQEVIEQPVEPVEEPEPMEESKTEERPYEFYSKKKKRNH